MSPLPNQGSRSVPAASLRALASTDGAATTAARPGFAPPAPVTVDVLLAPGIAVQLSKVQVAFIVGHLTAACAALAAGGEVRIRIVADAEMSDAHLRYARIQGPTDVLTFDLSDGASAATRLLDCDLLLCFDEAARQAAPRHHSVERELLLYALHGLLHCLGEDDHSDTGYNHMHAAEDRILEQLGVGITFAAPTLAPHFAALAVAQEPTS